MRSEPRFDAAIRANARDRSQNSGSLPAPWENSLASNVTDISDAPLIGAGGGLELGEIAQNYDVKSITPRQMVVMSFDLYFSGHLSREQYTELAFQSELMPNFDATIGALIGARAAPDRPRDYTSIWRARLKFEKDHCAESQRIVERTQKILELLESIDKTGKSLRPAKYLTLDRRTSPKPTLQKRKISKAVRAVDIPPLSLSEP